MALRNRLTRLLLPALLLALLGLTGCASGQVKEMASPFDGTWYYAKTGVACRFGEGKIYRDDPSAATGQSLAGIYTEFDDHLEANLAETGGVDQTRTLYLVSDDDLGPVLRDRADGRGQVYFYQDPLAAMDALVEAGGGLAAEEDSSPAPSERAEPSPSEADPAVSPAPDPAAADPSAALSEPGALEYLSPAPDPAPAGGSDSGATRANSSMVWIPKSGSRYHSTPSCSGMKNPTQISLSEAQSKGYTPCQRCY